MAAAGAAEEIENWSLTSLQQRLVKTGGRLVKHARYYWLLLAESHLTRRLFGGMVRRIEALAAPFVRTARAKGLPERLVVYRHALRNALIPILTDISLQLPGLFVGSFLIEVFFSIPGLGREVLLAVNRSDYPVIQAEIMLFSLEFVLINLIVDLLYGLVNPEIRLR